MSALPSVDTIQDAARTTVGTLQTAVGTAGDALGDTVDAVGDALEGKEREIGIGAVVLIAAGVIVGVIVLKALRGGRGDSDASAAKAAAKRAPAKKAPAKKAPAKKAVAKKAAPAKH